MWGKVLIMAIIAFGIYLTFRSPKENCVCGFTIPEGGGVCKWCGEYNGRMTIKIDGKDELRERELKRIEEEKSKGNSYNTFL